VTTIINENFRKARQEAAEKAYKSGRKLYVAASQSAAVSVKSGGALFDARVERLRQKAMPAE